MLQAAFCTAFNFVSKLSAKPANFSKPNSAGTHVSRRSQSLHKHRSETPYFSTNWPTTTEGWNPLLTVSNISTRRFNNLRFKGIPLNYSILSNFEQTKTLQNVRSKTKKKKGNGKKDYKNGDIATEGENTSPRPLFGSLRALGDAAVDFWHFFSAAVSFAFSQEY
jgi:hypothetical protein